MRSGWHLTYGPAGLSRVVVVASVRIGIPVESIIPTTNHLESFNFVLKYKFINPNKHSGHRLRFDIFIHLLVKEIVPEVYYRRFIQSQYVNWFARTILFQLWWRGWTWSKLRRWWTQNQVLREVYCGGRRTVREIQTHELSWMLQG